MHQLIKRMTFVCLLVMVQVSTSFAQKTIEDMLRPTFDSSQVVQVIVDSILQGPDPNVYLTPKMAHPPGTFDYTLDKTRIVGDVPYELCTSIAGQVELSIPIETFASIYESTPQISLQYSSQGGMSFMGNGWSLSGLSKIETTNKTYFTDGNTSGRNRALGPRALDGNRLILQESNDSIETYYTQTGNFKVLHKKVNGVDYGYLVYSPDGSIGIYGVCSAYGNTWYQSDFISIDEREVSYSYLSHGGNQLIQSIDFGEGRSLNFYYNDASNIQTQYIDSEEITYQKKLSRIDVTRNNHILRQYVMTYRSSDITAPLVQVDMLDSIGNAVNPLHFYYQGDNSNDASDNQRNKQLSVKYDISNPNQFISLRGKLDYATEDDAVIMYPNRLSYYIKGSDRVRNRYKEHDPITISYNLNSPYTSSSFNIETGDGFVNAFCMDVDGIHGEEFVKVNQSVYNNLDHIRFEIYGLRQNGMQAIDIVNRTLPDLVKNGEHSIWPTSFLTGDFTGDGKEEVILCRTSNPLDGVEESATFLMIDLDQDIDMCSGTLDQYQIYLRGTRYSEDVNDERNKNSDRLFATDIDGDGKLEMCILNNSGLDIYRFNYNESGNVIKTKSHTNVMSLSEAHDYYVNVGDVNGDGNTDLIFLPIGSNQNLYSWMSKGDGSFAFKYLGIQSDEYSDMMCFDYDLDGQTDIVKVVKPSYISSHQYTTIYKIKNGVTSGTPYSIMRSAPSIIIPISVFGQSSNVAMISIKSDGLYDIHRFANPMTMDALLVGIADSRGRISQMQYKQLYQGEYYAPGFNAVFPYSTYAGGMFVCSSMSLNAGSITERDLTYNYTNATIHKQGLGFCGFRSIQTTDNLRNETTVQTFNPENYGVPVTIESAREQSSYSYRSTLSNDKRIQVMLTGKQTLSNMTGLTSSSTYTYDAYGNMLNDTTTSGGITHIVQNTYRNVDNDSQWIIGQATRQTETISRNGQTVTNGKTTNYNSFSLPDTITTWINNENNVVRTEVIKYDAYNRPCQIKSRKYAGAWLKRDFDYVGESRIPSGITDENRILTTVEYGDFGVIQSSVIPNLIEGPDEDDTIPSIPLFPNFPLGGGNEVNSGGNPILDDPVLPNIHPLVTTYHYTPLGLQDTIISPGGIVQATSVSWADNSLSDALYMTEQTETGRPTVRTWSDALGRNLRRDSQRFDGQWSRMLFEYDEKGRLVSESYPTLTSSPSQWINYSYDGFDRIIEKEYPDEDHIDTYSYNGLITTSTIDGVTTTRTVDAAGNLVEVNDAGGRIEYTLRPDGQPDEIRVGGIIATTIEYDKYGRRTAINDPSAGRRTTTYDENGFVYCESDARGEAVTNFRDKTGQLIRRTTSDGLITTYTYDLWHSPNKVSDNHGNIKTWEYDTLRRKVAEKLNGFKKTFSYSNNQVSNIGYSINNVYICSENYNYSNGHLSSIILNTGDTIWALKKQNPRFLPTKSRTGSVTQSFSYDLMGNVINRSANLFNNSDSFHWQLYGYDTATGNMVSRDDIFNGVEESFDYDNMNRLTDITVYNESYGLHHGEMQYDGKGNVLSRTDAGQYGYSSSMPYALNELTSLASSVPMRDQYLHFNAMQRPDTIIENGLAATFGYYGDGGRSFMTVTGSDGYRYHCKYYDQQYNEFTKTVGGNTSTKSVLWLGGTPYNAPVALLKDYGQTGWQVVSIVRDNLGSITHIVDTNGIVLQQLSYTAWGQLRNPLTGAVYAPDNQPELLLGRGYTGHEHLPWFGLINMNVRLYDPAVGRFLSPDPIVQAPDNTQNFNRYSYCMNNPLRYVDPLGLFFKYLKNCIIDGEFFSTMGIIDEVVIIGQRNNASMNICLYGGWTSQYHVNGNQFGGNGYGNTFFSGGGRGGVSSQLSNNPLDWSQYYLPASPSSPQSFWQSLIIGASSLNEHLGIANGYAEFAFKNLSTGDKSKLVYDLSKEIESITGNKIRNYSNIYKNVIPSAFDATKKGSLLAGAGFVIYDAYSNQQFRASNALDLVMSGISLIPTYGWVIDGLYIGSNYFLKLYTGNTIGDFLNEWMESEYELQNGAIIK